MFLKRLSSIVFAINSTYKNNKIQNKYFQISNKKILVNIIYIYNLYLWKLKYKIYILQENTSNIPVYISSTGTRACRGLCTFMICFRGSGFDFNSSRPGLQAANLFNMFLLLIMYLYKSYLEDWETWKKSFDDNNCILDIFDVVNLYPSLSIVLVSKALVEALELSSEFETSMIKYWIKTIGPEKFEVPFIYKSSKI